MKTFRILTTCALAALLAVGCGVKEDQGGKGGGEIDYSQIEVKPAVGKDLYGQITDTNGKPVRGVVVSDGTTSVATNAYGIYQIKRSPNARFVYYSTPWDYEIEVAEDCSAAKFYAEIPENAGTHRQDFTLRKRTAGASEFTVIGVGDPQVKVPVDNERFTSETTPALKDAVARQTKPCIILSMGDQVEDNLDYMAATRLNLGSTGAPAFSVVGNHDKMRYASDPMLPRNADDHCALWGPTDYSFNMGNYLFIAMDNVIYEDGWEYYGGFTGEQVAWLEQHVAPVSSDRSVILFCHIPVHSSKNTSRILDILKRFKSLDIFSGHTHDHRNIENDAYYEHVHSAACGAWWWSNLNSDATPHGFTVYEMSGNSIKNAYFQPTKHDRSFQFRLYRGDYAYKGWGNPDDLYGVGNADVLYDYSFGLGDDVIVANVWNADSKWDIAVYENGTYTGSMSRISMKDMWGMAVHEGNTYETRINRWLGVTTTSSHLYSYKLKDKTAEVKVVVTDRYNNKYESSEFATDVTEGVSLLKNENPYLNR